MATSNPYGKTRPSENPYAVYRSNLPALRGWEWRILKMNRNPEKTRSDALASAFCEVSSPMNAPLTDLGDTYVREIGEVFVSGEDVLAGVPRVTEGARPPLERYGF